MKHLTYEQRYTIAKLLQRGFTQTFIAGVIGVNNSKERKKRFSSNRKFTYQMQKQITNLIRDKQWSLEQIVGYYKSLSEPIVCVEWIYQHIRKYKAQGGLYINI